MLCWLGFYLFLLAVFRIQIKKIKHEAIGLVIVLVTPVTFLWIFPWKKIALCANTHNLKKVKVYWLTVCTYGVVVLLVHIQYYGRVERCVAQRENVQTMLQLLNQLLCFGFISGVSPDAFLDLLFCEPSYFQMHIKNTILLELL